MSSCGRYTVHQLQGCKFDSQPMSILFYFFSLFFFNVFVHFFRPIRHFLFFKIFLKKIKMKG